MSARPSLLTIWQRMQRHPGSVFLRSTAGSMPYGRLVELVGRFCADFDRAEPGQGDRLLIVTANEPVAAAAFLAGLLDGLVPVMLSPDSKPERLRAILRSVEPRLVVADQGLADVLAIPGQAGARVVVVPPSLRLEKQGQGMSAAWRGVRRLFRAESADGDLDLPAAGREPSLPGAGDATAYILFTSGTTSAPSGVQISRNSLLAQLETLTRLFDYTDASRIFNATPLAHTDGLVQGPLLAAANGATLLRPGLFSLPALEEWLDRISGWQATHFITNPTVLALISRYAGHEDYFDDGRFFGVLSSASTLRPELWHAFEERFGCSVFNLYGMTETVANAVYAGRHPEMGPVGTIGVPVDCEARLVQTGSDGSWCESRLEGELQIRGENVFQCYWKDPERTAATLIDGGWMRTGDLARRRENGGLDIVGRIKTMINMGGQSILPEEIDEVLAGHPAVLDVATVGLADPDFEEVAVSAVVLERAASESELAEHCRRHLEPLKVPKRILAVDRIPRGDAGKPQAGALRDLLHSLLEGNANAQLSEPGTRVQADAVCAMAADVFRVPAEDLSLDSSPATVEGWDSFNQLNLMIEAEHRFSIRIPAAQVASIRTLGDLLQAINAKR